MSLFHQHYPGDSVSTAFSIVCRSCHPFTYTTNPQSASARHSKNSSEVHTMSFYVGLHVGSTRKLSQAINLTSLWVHGSSACMVVSVVALKLSTRRNTYRWRQWNYRRPPKLQYIWQNMKYRATRTLNLEFLSVMRDTASVEWVSRELERLHV